MEDLPLLSDFDDTVVGKLSISIHGETEREREREIGGKRVDEFRFRIEKVKKERKQRSNRC